MKLSELFNMYGTDKENYHRYGTGCYDTLLLPLKHKPIRLLEVGVFYGNSMIAWEAFFPNAIITGVDNNPMVEMPGVVRADAYSDEFLDTIARNSLDVVIDDGPHGLINQEAFLRKYWDKVAPTGMLIIEDIALDSDLEALNKIYPYEFTVHTINIGGATNSRIAVWVKP